MVSAILLAAGLSTLFTALLSFAFGREFSYFVPGAGAVPQTYPPLPPVPSAPDLRALDVANGATTAIVGATFLVVHAVVLRVVEGTTERRSSTLSHLTAVAGAIIFGLTAIGAVVEGSSGVVSRLTVAASDEHPGAAVARALAFSVGWIWFLVQAARHLRRAEDHTDAP